MKNREMPVVSLSFSDSLGSPRVLTTYPEKRLVHRVPYGQTHLVTLYLHNTSTSSVDVLGMMGKADDSLAATVPPGSTLALGPFLLSSTDSRRSRIRLGVMSNQSSLRVSGYAEIRP